MSETTLITQIKGLDLINATGVEVVDETAIFPFKETNDCAVLFAHILDSLVDGDSPLLSIETASKGFAAIQGINLVGLEWQQVTEEKIDGLYQLFRAELDLKAENQLIEQGIERSFLGVLNIFSGGQMIVKGIAQAKKAKQAEN